MLSEAIRHRLEQLNRERLPAVLRSPRPRAMCADDCTLSARLPGEIEQTTSGRHYVIRQRLDQLWRDAARHLAAMARPGSVGELASDAPPDLDPLVAGFPQATLFLDLETCGFAGSAIFLVGIVRHSPEGLVIEQFLARDYTEERSLLESLNARLTQCGVLVTFNGKSFDWPMVQDRGVYHRLDKVPLRANWLHYDLLHHARRQWKSKLPNCKLQTLERFVCGRVRRDDVPGSQIPAEYHEFVRTGDARRLEGIVRHNALDLVTLVQLTIRLLTPKALRAPG